MTARETALGALTAADMGKRVRVGGERPGWVLTVVRHGLDATGSPVTLALPSTTPVTVYDEEEA